MKIAIIDLLGLPYDGTTVQHRGLGGSESAVIYISRELVKLGFDVTVYNKCRSDFSSPGVYDGVRYIDHQTHLLQSSVDQYDIVISSRSTAPFRNDNQYVHLTMAAKYRVLWMHDTFCQGDEVLEEMIVGGFIDEVFTLSDFHSWYVTSCNHGRKRNFEVLKHKFFQTRNGVNVHDVVMQDHIIAHKDKNRFVYNASATKGLVPLITKIWPEIKKAIPQAKLTCIGGYYRFPNDKPDQQEQLVRKMMDDKKLRQQDVTFTGVITQREVSEIVSNSYMMLYPTAFPETFGISTLESLVYRTPVVTNRFGALEETAIDQACYKINYSSTNNALFNNIDEENQTKLFVQTVIEAYNNDYLHKQKQWYCSVVDDIVGWDTVAIQWKQHLYYKLGKFLNVDQYRRADRINQKVARIFGRRFNNDSQRVKYTSYGEQKPIVIISPFRNAANYIEKCIRSVAQQDYDNYQHWLIDDASDDDGSQVARETIQSLPQRIRPRFKLTSNPVRAGAIVNQLRAFKKLQPDCIVMLLDGDDWLVNNNTVFDMYNDLYHNGVDFTYGSMWSEADQIPLIAQQYPQSVINNKQYSKISFPWKIPYTHLRTFNSNLTKNLDHNAFKKPFGEWMMAGADNPLFYQLIEKASNPVAVKEIVCHYNDLNPLNDYKVNAEEQNRNAGL